MGQHFGQLIKLRGIITFKISPHEQRAFAGAISHGLPNWIRRIREEVFFVTTRELFRYSYLSTKI